MGQAVDAGIGGDAGRHGEGELVIDDGGERQGAQAGDQHLLAAFGVGDDGEAGGLAAGAGRGGDGDDGQAGVVGGEGHLEVAHVRAGVARPAMARMAMAFAVSIGGAAAEADQAVVIALAPARRRRRSMTVSVGSGTVSLNTPGCSPAASSGSRQRRTRPEETMKGSVTTSGRQRPKAASTSAIWATAPPPTRIMRGETSDGDHGTALRRSARRSA